MPLYAVDNEKIPGAVPFPPPGGGRFKDVDGHWLPMYVFRADTGSGRVDRYDVDEFGRWQMNLAIQPVVLSETYKAPLIYVLEDRADNAAAKTTAVPLPRNTQ